MSSRCYGQEQMAKRDLNLMQTNEYYTTGWIRAWTSALKGGVNCLGNNGLTAKWVDEAMSKYQKSRVTDTYKKMAKNIEHICNKF